MEHGDATISHATDEDAKARMDATDALRTTARDWFELEYTRCVDLAETSAAARVYRGGFRGTMRRDLRAELIAHLVEVCPDALEHGGDIWSWFVREVVAPRGSRAGQYRPFRVWRRERAKRGAEMPLSPEIATSDVG